jgi:hypothetical protein
MKKQTSKLMNIHAIMLIIAFIIVLISCFYLIFFEYVPEQNHIDYQNSSNSTITNGDLYFSLENGTILFRPDGSVELIEVNLTK